MTLEAAAFGGLFRGSLWTMALLAGVNPGQENIGRLAAIGRAIVAGGARHHAMGVMIEFGMR